MSHCQCFNVILLLCFCHSGHLVIFPTEWAAVRLGMRGGHGTKWLEPLHFVVSALTCEMHTFSV